MCIEREQALQQVLPDILEKFSVKTLFQKSLIHTRIQTVKFLLFSRQFEKFRYLNSLNQFDLKVTAAWPIKSLLGKAEEISVPEKNSPFESVV